MGSLAALKELVGLGPKDRFQEWEQREAVAPPNNTRRALNEMAGYPSNYITPAGTASNNATQQRVMPEMSQTTANASMYELMSDSGNDTEPSQSRQAVADNTENIFEVSTNNAPLQTGRGMYVNGAHDTESVHYAVAQSSQDPARGEIKTFEFGNMRNGLIDAQDVIVTVYRNNTGAVSCAARSGNVDVCKQVEFGVQFDSDPTPHYLISDHVMTHSEKQYQHVVYFELQGAQSQHVRGARIHIYPSPMQNAH